MPNKRLCFTLGNQLIMQIREGGRCNKCGFHWGGFLIFALAKIIFIYCFAVFLFKGILLKRMQCYMVVRACYVVLRLTPIVHALRQCHYEMVLYSYPVVLSWSDPNPSQFSVSTAPVLK